MVVVVVVAVDTMMMRRTVDVIDLRKGRKCDYSKVWRDQAAKKRGIKARMSRRMPRNHSLSFLRNVRLSWEIKEGDLRARERITV